MKKLATPVKNEVDESFIKISHLNQENKDTYFDYKQVPQIELLMLQVLAWFCGVMPGSQRRKLTRKTLPISRGKKRVKNKELNWKNC